jgi:hypothetical protein
VGTKHSNKPVNKALFAKKINFIFSFKLSVFSDYEYTKKVFCFCEYNTL